MDKASGFAHSDFCAAHRAEGIQMVFSLFRGFLALLLKDA